MLIQRVIRFSILFAFVAMVGGGPGFHYAPFLGLHSCDDHGHAGHHHGENSDLPTPCGCGQTHVSLVALDAELQQGHETGDSAVGHEHCSICQFYSDVNLGQADVEASFVSEQAQRFAIVAKSAPQTSPVSFYFERGPPVA